MTKPAQTNTQEPPERHPQISQMNADYQEQPGNLIGANRRNLWITIWETFWNEAA